VRNDTRADAHHDRAIKTILVIDTANLGVSELADIENFLTFSRNNCINGGLKNFRLFRHLEKRCLRF
jgi:hypothetical protein